MNIFCHYSRIRWRRTNVERTEVSRRKSLLLEFIWLPADGGIKPGTARWEARPQPPCYSVSQPYISRKLKEGQHSTEVAFSPSSPGFDSRRTEDLLSWCWRDLSTALTAECGKLNKVDQTIQYSRLKDVNMDRKGGMISRERERYGCIIWAEFVQTLVGCSEPAEIFWFTTEDQFYSRKNSSKLVPILQPYLPWALALPATEQFLLLCVMCLQFLPVPSWYRGYKLTAHYYFLLQSLSVFLCRNFFRLLPGGTRRAARQCSALEA